MTNKDPDNLFDAIKSGDGRDVERLLDQGANINEKQKQNGFTPLMYACSLGNEDIIKILLKRGADVWTKDSNSWDAKIHCKTDLLKNFLQLYMDYQDSNDSEIQEDTIDDLLFQAQTSVPLELVYRGEIPKRSKELSRNDVDKKIRIEYDNLPQRVLWFFILFCCWTFVFTFFLLIGDMYYGDLGILDNLSAFFYLIAIIVVAGLLLMSLDSCYMADLENRQMNWQSSWFGLTGSTKIADFNEILGISVEWIKPRPEAPVIVMFTTSGRKYHLSNRNFHKGNDEAKALAKLLNLPFVQCKKNKIAKAVRDKYGSYKIEIRSQGLFGF
ncbi:ankyrin repeat domain-containing protein [Candidatus Riflebacteria bacterium]